MASLEDRAVPPPASSDHGSTVAGVGEVGPIAGRENDVPGPVEEVVQVEEAAEREMPARPARAEVWVFHADEETRQADLAELPAIVADDAYFAWIDLSEYSEEELEEVARLLNLHEIGVRAALSPWRRPRLDVFGDHFFVSVTVAELADERHQVRARELDLFVGRNFLVSAHKHRLPFKEQLLTRARQSPTLVQLDSAFMLYIILSQLLEYYEELTEHLEDEIQRMEERALTTTSDDFLEELLYFKRYIFALSRLVEQHRTIFTAFLRADFAFVDEEQTAPYFRELEAELTRLADLLLGAKEAVNGTFDIYVSHVSHRTNQIMKLLTMVSTVLLPASVILGFFGTNFQGINLYDAPDFWFMLVSIVVISALILALFHRRGWF